VEGINITIDETGRPKSKEEEKKSMQQLFEEEDEKEEEEEDEDEDEENPTEVEEQVQQVSPKIILQIILLETKMRELRLEEKSVHQNKHT
jgi:hypothetical protein